MRQRDVLEQDQTGPTRDVRGLLFWLGNSLGHQPPRRSASADRGRVLCCRCVGMVLCAASPVPATAGAAYRYPRCFRQPVTRSFDITVCRNYSDQLFAGCFCARHLCWASARVEVSPQVWGQASILFHWRMKKAGSGSGLAFCQTRITDYRHHVPLPPSGVPRRRLPRHVAWRPSRAHLPRRAGPHRSSGRAGAGHGPLRRAGAGLLPDGQPLPPGARAGSAHVQGHCGSCWRRA